MTTTAPLVAFITAVLVAGCTSPKAGPESTAPRPVRPSQAHLDLSGLPVPRRDVCDSIPEEGVTQALGGVVAETRHYGNGDEVEVVPGLLDISHEYGCVYAGQDGTVARMWIFARPVGSSEARTLVRRARRGRSCAFPDLLVFGAPGLSSVCEVRRPGEAPVAVRTRLQGLFGDSWLGCEVSEPLGRDVGDEPDGDVVLRTEQWCTEVVTAVSATP
jgi:hypothetical protein